LAKIHLAKKQLAMGDEAYRDMLQRVAGAPSAGALDLPKLEAVLKEMRRLGFRGVGRAKKGLSQKAQVRMIHAVWRDLQPHITDGSEAALRAFVQRQTKSAARPEGVSAPEFLGPQEANKVLEGLKAWLARVRQRAALAPAGGEA
jgi:phage gp16-like protein